MTEWKRASYTMLCGGPCGTMIKAGDPVLLFTLPGLTVKKARCARCAEQPVPVDLPTTPAKRALEPSTMVPLRSIRALPFDWKQKQADRE